MILRDFICTKCNNIIYDVFVDSTEIIFIDSLCAYCKNNTKHVTMPGGTGSRWRYADYPRDPDFYKGQIKAHSPAVYQKDSNGNNVYGSVPDKLLGDRREERREKIYFESAKKRGKNKLFIDQKVLNERE